MALSTKKIQGDQTIHYDPPRKQRKAAAEPRSMQPPLTPMIDVTFQLLLFFLLTCEFRESEGNIPGTLPAKGNIVQEVQQTPPPDPVQIRLRLVADRVAAYEMTGVPVVISSPAELLEHLKQRQDQLGSADVPIVIFPSADVPWQYVVEAFNAAVHARFTKIGFAEQIL
ncbi:MAG TPA: biopolymer transporter ExbD [Phycisphaerae bacterium]|nr:biopolymer transporter ExbD [Phycisphaerae bacterium]